MWGLFSNGILKEVFRSRLEAEKCITDYPNVEVREIFSCPLQEKRKKNKLTQAALAEKAEVSKRMVESYEQGSKDICKAECLTVWKMAKVLGCHAEDLLPEESR